MGDTNAKSEASNARGGREENEVILSLSGSTTDTRGEGGAGRHKPVSVYRNDTFREASYGAMDSRVGGIIEQLLRVARYQLAEQEAGCEKLREQIASLEKIQSTSKHGLNEQ